jgi:hypothetical protein
MMLNSPSLLARAIQRQAMEEEEEEVCPSRQVLATTFGPIGAKIKIITVILFIILVLVSQVVNTGRE